MGYLRSSGSVDKPEKRESSKIKFSDNDISANDIEYHTAEEPENEEEEEEEEESDSDEAPEEVSSSKVKKDIMAKQREEERAQEELRKRERERRRQRDIFNREQQAIKRTKEEHDKELPETLPDDVLESFETSEQVPVAPSKHIKLADMQDDAELMRRMLKHEKLQQLKKKTRKSVKKGPVHVQVQESSYQRRIPKSEARIVGARDKWLKRKSLGKK